MRGMVFFRAGCLVFSLFAASVLGAAEFGQPVTFAKGRPVEVGGLVVEYLGDRHVDHPVFKPGFTFQDFRIGNGKESKTVSWSGGTGCIGPVDFSLGGVTYMLELRASVARKGWLKDNQLVLWTEKGFLAASHKDR